MITRAIRSAPGWWLALFGVWPFVDPAHDGTTIASAIDLILHGVGIAMLIAGRSLRTRRLV